VIFIIRKRGVFGVFALTDFFYTTHIQDGIKLIHVPTRTATESEMGGFRGHMRSVKEAKSI